MMRRFVTIAVAAIFLLLNTSFIVKNNSPYYIVIDKSDYELRVYDSQGWLVSFPVVFGNKDLGDKMYEGDRRTPEGRYRIINKRPHNKWFRFMTLDYPNENDYAKFYHRKQAGQIPASAKIGGGIGIHGTWPDEDFAVDQFQNWTQGCISLKNEHMIHLYNYIPVGTEVLIQK